MGKFATISEGKMQSYNKVLQIVEREVQKLVESFEKPFINANVDAKFESEINKHFVEQHEKYQAIKEVGNLKEHVPSVKLVGKDVDTGSIKKEVDQHIKKEVLKESS